MIKLFFLALLLSFTDNKFLSGVDASTTFTLVNKCAYTIWPVISTRHGSTPIPINGFVLQEGDSHDIQATSSWIGQLWARTHCFANSTGKFTCLTGDCGFGKIECGGVAYSTTAYPTNAYPATLVEFVLNTYNGNDLYVVSLVNGYNLPLLVAPQGQEGANFRTAGCVADINAICPSALRVTAEGRGDIACKSACNAFNQDLYCCSGAYNSQSTCKPTNYSGVFKKWCAYNSQSTCKPTNYSGVFKKWCGSKYRPSQLRLGRIGSDSDTDHGPRRDTHLEGRGYSERYKDVNELIRQVRLEHYNVYGGSSTRWSDIEHSRSYLLSSGLYREYGSYDHPIHNERSSTSTSRRNVDQATHRSYDTGLSRSNSLGYYGHSYDLSNNTSDSVHYYGQSHGSSCNTSDSVRYRGFGYYQNPNPTERPYPPVRPISNYLYPTHHH